MKARRPLDYAGPSGAKPKAAATHGGDGRTPILPYLPMIFAILQLPCTMFFGGVLFLLCNYIGPIQFLDSLTPRGVVWVSLLPSGGGGFTRCFCDVLS